MLFFCMAFICEIILLIPLDFVLALYVVRNKEKIGFYAMIASLCSVISGGIGYAVGFLLFSKLHDLIFRVISKNLFEKVLTWYESHESIVVFFGCLLPLPFKIVTISAGVCGLSFWAFLGSIFAARILRFLFIGLISAKMGDKIISVLDKYFSYILIGVVFILILLFIYGRTLG